MKTKKKKTEKEREKGRGRLMNEEAKNKIKTERGISQELKRLKREIKTVRSKEKLLKK